MLPQQSLDPNDQAALHRRAQRFQREHDLERTRHMGNGTPQSYVKANQSTVHLFRGMSLSRDASPFGNPDDPEADPVWRYSRDLFIT